MRNVQGLKIYGTYLFCALLSGTGASGWTVLMMKNNDPVSLAATRGCATWEYGGAEKVPGGFITRKEAGDGLFVIVPYECTGKKASN